MKIKKLSVLGFKSFMDRVEISFPSGISGIVGPSDIEFDNTVKSEQVADFHLLTKNDGVAAPYTKPGWLGAIFDLIWPF